MRGTKAIAAFVLATFSGLGTVHGSVVIQTVPIGNAGNAADDTGYGSVGYSYSMAKYELTAGQYTEFLNAVAAADPYSLYNTSMASTSAGCKIVRSGASGSYSYSVAADYANRPVNFLSWGDAARFANWMHNGQPTGPSSLTTTEDGSYFLNGVVDSALNTIVRSANATWVIPSEDEWYKAAYHKNDGVTGNYWEFATQSNSTPGKLLIDPGNNANFGPNPATPIDGGVYWTTTIGEFENSGGAYGTFDQSGNIREWTEARQGAGTQRIVRGGDWFSNGVNMAAATRAGVASGGGSQNYIGMRLGRVPSPSSAAALAVGLLATARRRR